VREGIESDPKTPEAVMDRKGTVRRARRAEGSG